MALRNAIIRTAIFVRKARAADLLIGAWHAIPYFCRLFNGKPANPPSYVKFNMIRTLQKEFKLHTLVETGTYYGDTCYRSRKAFRRIITTEVDEALYERARRRLGRYENIILLKGDCVKLLPGIVRKQKQAALFFLDAHYSGAETGYGKEKDPILESLRIISTSKQKNVVLIDDLLTFEGTHVHLYDLIELVKKRFPEHRMRIYNDMIVLHP